MTIGIWDLNLRHLRAVAEVRRLGSISAASGSVSLTQPAITQAIHRLEAKLGLALFERRHNNMVALEAAALLAARAEAAFAHIGSSRVTMAQLRALTALGDTGSYVSAGAETGLSEPSLHRAVRDLALALALKRTLVERRGKGVAFTEHGRRTLRAFRLARAELEAALYEIDALKGRETGRIVVGAMPLSRAKILPAAVASFHAAFPDVRVRIVEGSWQELAEPLRDGDIDLMIGALRKSAPGADLVQEGLFDDQPVVVGRRNHPLAGGNPGIEALARYPWIVSSRGTPLRAGWERMFAHPAHPLPPAPIECGSVMTIRQILLDSDFLTLLSLDQVAVEIEAGWLAAIRPAPADLVRSIGVISRAGWRPTAPQSAFLALLRSLAAAEDEGVMRPD